MSWRAHRVRSTPVNRLGDTQDSRPWTQAMKSCTRICNSATGAKPVRRRLLYAYEEGGIAASMRGLHNGNRFAFIPALQISGAPATTDSREAVSAWMANPYPVRRTSCSAAIFGLTLREEIGCARICPDASSAVSGTNRSGVPAHTAGHGPLCTSTRCHSTPESFLTPRLRARDW